MKLSAVVLTKNNVNSITATITSLEFCDEIIVVDDGSTDKTDLVVKKLPKTKLFRRKLDNNFSQSRNFGLKQARGEWVIFVDADEVVSSQLGQEILTKINQADNHINGFILSRQDYFLNKKLKHGETSSVRLARLVKKDCGHWQGRVHEQLMIKGKVSKLSNSLLHRRSMSLSTFINKINGYSSLVAQEKKRFSWFEFLFYPLVKFIQNYFLRWGFLDGMPGFIMAYCMSLHSLLVRSKLYELEK